MPLRRTTARATTVAAVALALLVLASTAAVADDEFTVEVDDTSSPVTEGETLRVDASIEISEFNTTDPPDPETTLSIDGDVADTVASDELGFDPGDDQAEPPVEENVTLEWTTEEGDAGDHDAAVEVYEGGDEALEYANDTTAVTVDEPTPPEFEVSIEETTRPGTAGQTLYVDAAVTNTGGSGDSQTVVLRDFDGEAVHEQEIRLDGGETWNDSLNWPSSEDDVGTGDVTLESENDTDEQDVSLQPPMDVVFSTEGAVWSSPSIDDEGVGYVGSWDNHTYAFDTESGGELWSYESNGSVLSSPSPAGEMVYFGSNDGGVYAVDRETGGHGWTYETEGRVTSSPTVVDGTVYVGSLDGTMYALDAETGAEEWTFDTGSWVTSSPTVYDDTVYFGSHDASLYALNRTTGEEQWNDTADFWIRSSPVVEDGRVVVSTWAGNTHAYNASTGEHRWTYDTGSFQFVSDYWTSSPNVADGVVYVGSVDGNVYAVDLKTGKEEWVFETGEMVRSSPVIAGDTVYFGSHDHNLYAVDAESGEEQWRFHADDWVWSSPSVVDGTVYLAAAEGTVYGVDAPSEEDGDRYSFDTSGAVSDGSRVFHRSLGHHGETAAPWFDVEVTDATSPVYEGEDLEVNATVTNTGRAPDLQNVSFNVSGYVDNSSVELDAGENTSVEFTWSTVDGDSGEHTVAVASEDDEDHVDVVVEERRDAEPPTAEFFVTPKPDPTVPESTTLHSTASHRDPDVGIQEYRWRIHETNETLTGKNAKPTSLSTGSYTVTHTVTADNGLSDEAVDSFEVRGRPGGTGIGGPSYVDDRRAGEADLRLDERATDEPDVADEADGSMDDETFAEEADDTRDDGDAAPERDTEENPSTVDEAETLPGFGFTATAPVVLYLLLRRRRT